MKTRKWHGIVFVFVGAACIWAVPHVFATIVGSVIILLGLIVLVGA